jgi:hypothetical protein
MSAQSVDWTAIHAGLIAPFRPEEINWKPAGKTTPNTRVSLVAFIDSRAVADRLDSVVGLGNWSFNWEPVVVGNGEVLQAKGTLSIHGVSKSDVGSASNWEPSKGAISDALKRAAVLWGIGRYLYNLPSVMVTLDAHGKVPEESLATIRQRLAAKFAA